MLTESWLSLVSDVRGRRVRERSVVLLAILAILGSMLAYTAARPGSVLAAGEPTYFTFTAVSNVVAGETIPTITVSAFDRHNHLATNYDFSTAVVTSNLGDAPNGCPGCTADPGSLTGVPRSGTATLSGAVGYKAESLRNLTVTDSLTSVSDSTNNFTVDPAAVAQLDFNDATVPFNGQPIDTKSGAPIYSVCAPPAVSLANPCANPPTSTPVKVLARDQFGNRVLPTLVNISRDGGGFLNSATTSNGEASFGSALSISALGNFKLRAAAGTAPNAVSVQRRIVTDLEACDNDTCDNNANNSINPTPIGLQKAFGQIKAVTGGDFFNTVLNTNVLLTTQFVPGSEVSGQCGNNSNIGQATNLTVQGAGVASTKPETTMVLIIPKNTLKASGFLSRGTPSYNVCLGALHIGSVTPSIGWNQKATTKNGAPTPILTPGAEGRYWGIPADCGTAGLSTEDPCIGLRTKAVSAVRAYPGITAADVAAMNINDADLVVIIKKPFPWDGKAGIH